MPLDNPSYPSPDSRPVSIPAVDHEGPTKRFLRGIHSIAGGINKTAVFISVVAAVSFLIAWHMHQANSRCYVVTFKNGVGYEIDRRNGATWLLVRGTKHRMRDEAAANHSLQVIPFADRQKITGKGSVGPKFFRGELYNGSGWTVKEIIFRVTVKEWDDSVRWSRHVKEDVTIEPLSAGTFLVYTADEEAVESFTWQVTQASGYRSTSGSKYDTAHMNQVSHGEAVEGVSWDARSGESEPRPEYDGPGMTVEEVLARQSDEFERSNESHVGAAIVVGIGGLLVFLTFIKLYRPT